jgi:hypothetical protein
MLSHTHITLNSFRIMQLQMCIVSMDANLLNGFSFLVFSIQETSQNRKRNPSFRRIGNYMQNKIISD